MDLKTINILDLSKTIAAEMFIGKIYPWEVLGDIGAFISRKAGELDDTYRKLEGEDVWIGEGTTVDDCVQISGPAIIGKNCEIRHGAFIRGKVVVGDNVVIGNSSELKNSIIFDNAQIPHFNYVGDSIMGYKSHIGAGVKLSNLKSDKSMITIPYGTARIDTKLKKMGAVIGDYVEVGCNAVLNPGTVIGRNSNVYPLSLVRGYVPEACIHKNSGEIVEKDDIWRSKI